MPRALTMQRTLVPVADRARHLQRLRVRRDFYRAQQCRYWVFEEAAVQGAFVEFVEADAREALAAAHAQAADPPLDTARVYLEVELS